jgi:hypothetical protein
LASSWRFSRLLYDAVVSFGRIDFLCGSHEVQATLLLDLVEFEPKKAAGEK